MPGQHRKAVVGNAVKFMFTLEDFPAAVFGLIVKPDFILSKFVRDEGNIVSVGRFLKLGIPVFGLKPDGQVTHMPGAFFPVSDIGAFAVRPRTQIGARQGEAGCRHIILLPVVFDKIPCKCIE